MNGSDYLVENKRCVLLQIGERSDSLFRVTDLFCLDEIKNLCNMLPAGTMVGLWTVDGPSLGWEYRIPKVRPASFAMRPKGS